MAQSEITTIHSMIRESRQRKYKTAKEFWDSHQAELKVSYPHYSAVEKGTKFPDINLTIAIAKSLKLELKPICHLWAKDQMPDAQTCSFFEPIPGLEAQGLPTTVKMQLDEYYVFTEKQLPAFKEIPVLWEVLMFIMAFWDTTTVNEDKISKSMSVELKNVKRAVEWLRNEGLVYSENGNLKARRSFYHLPNTPQFKAVRDMNFRNAAEDILNKMNPSDLLNKEAYRTTFTRQLTRVQAQELCRHLDLIVGHMGNMADVGSELFSLTIAFGPRAKINLKKKESSSELPRPVQ